MQARNGLHRPIWLRVNRFYRFPDPSRSDGGGASTCSALPRKIRVAAFFIRSTIRSRGCEGSSRPSGAGAVRSLSSPVTDRRKVRGAGPFGDSEPTRTSSSIRAEPLSASAATALRGMVEVGRKHDPTNPPSAKHNKTNADPMTNLNGRERRSDRSIDHRIAIDSRSRWNNATTAEASVIARSAMAVSSGASIAASNSDMAPRSCAAESSRRLDFTPTIPRQLAHFRPIRRGNPDEFLASTGDASN